MWELRIVAEQQIRPIWACTVTVTNKNTKDKQLGKKMQLWLVSGLNTYTVYPFTVKFKKVCHHGINEVTVAKFCAEKGVSISFAKVLFTSI